MVFNSLVFAVFFVVVVAAYYGLKNWPARKVWLLLASYVFYGAWNPPFVALLWLSTIIDWYAAKGIERAPTKEAKKAWLMASLASNLGMLGFFKYGNFLLENGNWVLAQLGIEHPYGAPLDIILPMGISFYTFQTLSYTIDVYRGNMSRCRSFLDFALYVTFFPQLVAGPIVRAVDFLPQCFESKRATPRMFGWGLFLMTLGVFQKIVLADTFLAGPSDTIFGRAGGTLHPLDAWIGGFAFMGQVFFDFAGYSTCAIGAALCLGFHLTDNFRAPYASLGFSDFWRRWHISLSTWLKDYLYISLGGSRAGRSRHLFNLFITMVIGGLWHGASWNFVIWGGVHGLFLVGEHLLKGAFPTVDLTRTLPGRVGVRLFTFAGATVAQSIFRSRDVPAAGAMVASMFGAHLDGAQLLAGTQIFQVVSVMLGLIAVHWWMADKGLEELASRLPAPVLAVIWGLMLFGIAVAQGGSHAFIYFQF